MLEGGEQWLWSGSLGSRVGWELRVGTLVLALGGAQGLSLQGKEGKWVCNSPLMRRICQEFGKWNDDCRLPDGRDVSIVVGKVVEVC